MSDSDGSQRSKGMTQESRDNLYEEPEPQWVECAAGYVINIPSF